MTEEVKQETMEVEQEEGEILEDGEIADDEDDIVAIGQSSLGGPGAATKDEKENKESNQSKFGGTFSSYYPMDREDHFKPNKRKKKNNNKKRKRSNSIEAKRKQPGDQSHNAVDISDCINDTTFDSVELSDEDEYNFDMIDFDVLMEILGCTASKELVDSVPVAEKSKMMLRIMKIIKQLQGNDPNTSRRFARLKRRTKERPISNGNLGPIIRPPVYKAICKFYLEGKCHKGVDCHFSHDCVVPKRKELCKFYLQGFCGKGDDCLFMHGEFPCKFYHTNTECYSGENCRFSHAPLTEETREILRSYLDSGTLPDDPKPPPFRKLHKSLDRANIANKQQQQQQQQLPQQQQNFADPGEGDSAEFDSSFNKETEQLLSKPRPVILGDPTPKMKTSYSTWTWQQELKELEKAYTGLKKNLFCIDEIFAITEKPPTPRLEDDEDEVEAQILNYYNDMLDTDEMDEMLAVREIEEHQRKVREEEESLKDKEPFVDNTTVLPGSSEMGDEISEEEKRLIEASAHDEDLRILPGMSNAFLAAPPAINPVFDQVSYAPNVTTNSYFSPGDPFAIQSPFNGPDSFNGIGPAEIKSEPAAAYPDPFSKPSPDLTAADVSSMVRQIRNGTIGTEPPPVTSTAIPTAVGAPPVKPEYRDPRLNRAKDPRSQANTSGSSSQAALPLVQVEEKPVHKPFIKLCNPNVIVDYKMVLIRLSTINYACYYDMYMTDSSMKNDPRLRKFFSDQKPANTDLEYSAPSVAPIKSEPENTFMTLPALNLPPVASATVLGTPPTSSGIVKPPADLAAKEKSELLPASPPVSRDPRIRSKEMDRSRNSDLQIAEQVDNKSPPSVENTKTAPEAATAGGGEEESKDSTLNSAELTNGDDKEEASRVEDNSATPSTTAAASTDALASMPSYAIAAYAPTRSLYSSASTSMFKYSNYSSTSCDSALSTSTNQTNDNGGIVPDVDDEDSDNDQLEVLEEVEEEDEEGKGEENTLKATVNGVSEEINVDNSIASGETETPTWPTPLTNSLKIAPSNSIDSDNEMEIDLQHHESEADSENELIIANSEPEDNSKECESEC